jgi:hypothetical protein
VKSKETQALETPRESRVGFRGGILGLPTASRQDSPKAETDLPVFASIGDDASKPRTANPAGREHYPEPPDSRRGGERAGRESAEAEGQ